MPAAWKGKKADSRWYLTQSATVQCCSGLIGVKAVSLRVEGDNEVITVASKCHQPFRMLDAGGQRTLL
jgi:hypothetical protein